MIVDQKFLPQTEEVMSCANMFNDVFTRIKTNQQLHSRKTDFLGQLDLAKTHTIFGSAVSCNFRQITLLDFNDGLQTWEWKHKWLNEFCKVKEDMDCGLSAVFNTDYNLSVVQRTSTLKIWKTYWSCWVFTDTMVLTKKGFIWCYSSDTTSSMFTK